jgi:hypothetical protein
VGAIALTLYPIAIQPMLDPQKYKDIQKQTRAVDLILANKFMQKNLCSFFNLQGIDQEKIQPGNMRVWSNPFEPLPEHEKEK